MSASVSVALPAIPSLHLGQMHGERLDLWKVMKVLCSSCVHCHRVTVVIFHVISIHWILSRQCDSLACLTHQVAVPALEDPGGRRQLLKTHLEIA